MWRHHRTYVGGILNETTIPLTPWRTQTWLVEEEDFYSRRLRSLVGDRDSGFYAIYHLGTANRATFPEPERIEYIEDDIYLDGPFQNMRSEVQRRINLLNEQSLVHVEIRVQLDRTARSLYSQTFRARGDEFHIADFFAFVRDGRFDMAHTDDMTF